MKKSNVIIYNELERLTLISKKKRNIDTDPLSIVKAYKGSSNQELIGWIVSSLSYGRVTVMMPAIKAIISSMGKSPASWALERDASHINSHFKKHHPEWKYRFHTATDIGLWVGSWRSLVKQRPLEEWFSKSQGGSMDSRLSLLIADLKKNLPESRGIRFNLANPTLGSAAKRWRMMLRWFIRNEFPDLGIWDGSLAEDLIIPVDTHIHRISGYLGMHHSKIANNRTATQITQVLKTFNPRDPLKYDFPLSHMGIDGRCPTQQDSHKCRLCGFYKVCLR